VHPKYVKNTNTKNANTNIASTLLAHPEIRADQSIELLKRLHILTRDGKLNQDSRRKLKQVYHLYQFIEKILNDLDGDITLADHGAGKSYLGFIIYDLFFKSREATNDAGSVYGIEARADLVEKSQALAALLGFDRMHFFNMSVAMAAADAKLPATFDIVTALHACDTATDDAIAFGLAKRAKYMVLVPCCQAEIARALNADKARALSHSPLAELWRHPLHTREMGAQITNVLRCLFLEASGYQVTVTELVGWEHSLKNELILAKHIGKPNRNAATRLRSILESFGLGELLTTRYKLVS